LRLPPADRFSRRGGSSRLAGVGQRLAGPGRWPAMTKSSASRVLALVTGLPAVLPAMFFFAWAGRAFAAGDAGATPPPSAPAPAAAPPPGASSPSRALDAREVIVPIPGAERLRIDNPLGNVTVRAWHRTDAVHIVAEKQSASAEALARLRVHFT